MNPNRMNPNLALPPPSVDGARSLDHEFRHEFHAHSLDVLDPLVMLPDAAFRLGDFHYAYKDEGITKVVLRNGAVFPCVQSSPDDVFHAIGSATLTRNDLVAMAKGDATGLVEELTQQLCDVRLMGRFSVHGPGLSISVEVPRDDQLLAQDISAADGAIQSLRELATRMVAHVVEVTGTQTVFDDESVYLHADDLAALRQWQAEMADSSEDDES